MDPLNDFIACDQVNVAINGQVSSNPAVVTTGPLNAGNVSRCVPKGPGSLAFTVTAAELGFPQLALAVTFDGAYNGVDTHGNPLVTWSVDRAYSIPVQIDGVSATITHITGTMTVVLTSVPTPTSNPNCGGSCHSDVVQFFSPGTTDFLAVDVTVDVGGIFGTESGTLRIDGLTLVGTAAKPVGTGLAIGVKKNSCGIGAVEGGAVELVSTLASAANPTYLWSVIGAAPALGELGTSPTYRIAVPSPATPFTATLHVIDGTCAVMSRITVVPLTAEQAAAQARTCRLLREHQIINPFWNPLGPDGPPEPELTAAGVAQLLQSAQRLVELATGWLAVARDVGESPIAATVRELH